jgi:WD40 repeat protein
MNRPLDLIGSQGKGEGRNKNYGKTNGLMDEDENYGLSSSNSVILDVEEHSFKSNESSVLVTKDKGDSIKPEIMESNSRQEAVAVGEHLPLGDFVSNSAIDHGVVLVTKMFHGDVPTAMVDSTRSVHTRSRVKAVSVVCLSRCPLGGHFATGCDDGLVRIWLDSPDSRIEELDSHILERPLRHFPCRSSSNQPQTGTFFKLIQTNILQIRVIRLISF